MVPLPRQWEGGLRGGGWRAVDRAGELPIVRWFGEWERIH